MAPVDGWLRGKGVLVTRPRDQAGPLIAMIENAGARAIGLPAIEILAMSEQEIDKQKILDLDCYDYLIAISVNAAQCLRHWVDCFWPQIPPHLLGFAVGESSAQELEKLGLVTHFPQKGTGALALLGVTELQEPAGKRVLVAKGEGGRDLLRQELSKRGAQVDELDLYRRVLPEYDKARLALLLQQPIDAIVATSLAILENTLLLLNEHQVDEPLLDEDQDKFKHLPLVTVSPRISDAARAMGFTQVFEAADASDASILRTLNIIG